MYLALLNSPIGHSSVSGVSSCHLVIIVVVVFAAVVKDALLVAKDAVPL